MSDSNGRGSPKIPERVLKILNPTEEELEYRRKLYPDVSAVENVKLLCTICQKDVKHIFLLKKKSYKHIFLQVAICKGCLKFYDDGIFSVDEDGDDKYCRWCGQGGTLCLCSNCPSTFCKKCIRTNLERKYLLAVDKDDWLCFFCDPTPLYKLRAVSWAMDEHLANIKKKEKKKAVKIKEPKKPSAAPKANNAPVITVKQPVYPSIDLGNANVFEHVEAMKYWISDMCNMVNPTMSAPRWNECRSLVEHLQTPYAFMDATRAVESFMDHEIERLIRFRQQYIEGLTKLKEMCEKRVAYTENAKENCVDGNGIFLKYDSELVIVENPKARKRRKAMEFDSEAATTNGGSNATFDSKNTSDCVVNNPTVSENNSLVDMFESSMAEEETKSCQEKDDDAVEQNGEARPVIRLRNLLDLIDPKLTQNKIHPIKAEAILPEKKLKRLSTKPESSKKKSVELIMLSSDDSDYFIEKETSLKKRPVNHEKRKGLKNSKEIPKVNPISDSDSIKEPVQPKLFTTSESEGEGEAQSKKEVEGPKKSQKTDVLISNLESNSKQPAHPSSSTSSESEDKKQAQSKEMVSISMVRVTGNPKTDSTKTAGAVLLCNEKTVDNASVLQKSEDHDSHGSVETVQEKDTSTKNTDGSSDSTSSSDPLSGSSSDSKKYSPRKINRSYFSDSSDTEKKREKPRRKVQHNVFHSDSDSSFDGKGVLKKRTVTSTPSNKSLRSIKKPGNVAKSKRDNTDEEENDSDSDLDMDIERLCNLKSLRSKRAHSSTSGLSSSTEEDDDAKVRKGLLDKKKQACERLSDFYDSGDNEQREDDGVQGESLEDTFRREFSQYNVDNMVQEDIRATILNMSSSSEQEPQPASSEEDVEVTNKKKKNSESHKSRRDTKGEERPKGKKKYADKLMEMSIDSDSDEMQKGLQRYEKLKEKRAQNACEKESDEDTPVVIKRETIVQRKKGKTRKMFSDSDESPLEDEEKSEEAKSGDDEGDGGENKNNKRSASDSDSSLEKPQKKPKKRRRIRTGSDSDSDSNSDDGGKNGKSPKATRRKSIRRILKEDDLKQTTQAALKSEQERKKRISEKQQLYNAMVAKTSEEHKELTELVLDFNPKTKENIVVVDPTLVKKLKPHQAEGIKFMWDSCFETLEMAKTKNGSGCILAHCMGLGKSLQVVTLIHTLLTHPDIGVRTVLVVAPVSTVLNWANEFDKWLNDVGSGQDVSVFHMTRCAASHRSYLLNDWFRQGGVLIMGYNLLRTLSNPKARVKAAFKKVFQEKLVDPGPDVVVCDEGHILKNEKTAISVTMSKMKTRRRIVLTGTPLQNNLVEYHCMVQFVRPNLLGTKKEFTNRFVNPIQNGQFEDSTPHDVKIMKRRAHVLHTMLDGLVQRKDYNVLTPYLPPKYEYVIHLKLSDVQVKLYRYYLLNMVHGGDGEADGTAPKGKRLFVDFQNLMWICLHPRTLLMKSVKDDVKAEMEFDDTDEEGSLKDFIDNGSSSSSEFKTSSSGSDSEKSGSEKPKPPRRKTRGQGSVSEPEEEPAPTKRWWSELIEEEQMDDIRQSSKLFLFFTILKYCEEIGDKLLIFSQSLYTLDLLEYFLSKIDEESQKPEEERIAGIKGFEGSWAKGLDYFRLDGSSACENRESWCKHFNRPDNVRARLFLISTRAGGLGINLTGANRVIIFDASWNPSFDVQSLFRVYRFGQEKPCYIYRFLSKGTMEEKIYERQVAKLSTSLRVIDEQQIDRHFSHSALAELYMFDPEGSELQGTPVLPKDRLMAELLQNHSDIILSHHQHDSLLENQEDQGLTEEERKAAWAEFENEKNQKPVFQNANMMSSLVTMMMEVRTKLKIQNPAWNEDQLRMGALQILQQYPDFKAMAPYLGMLSQQMQLQQQQLQMNNQGLATMPNPQFPGMSFPSFQYPLYTSNQPQLNNLAHLNNLTAGRVNNPGMVNNVAMANSMAQVQQNVMEQLLKQNTSANLNSLLVNPKHPAQPNPAPKITTVRSLQKVQPPGDAAKAKSTGAGTSTEPITLDDSGPIELPDD